MNRSRSLLVALGIVMVISMGCGNQNNPSQEPDSSQEGGRVAPSGSGSGEVPVNEDVA